MHESKYASRDTADREVQVEAPSPACFLCQETAEDGSADETEGCEAHHFAEIPLERGGLELRLWGEDQR